MDVFNGREMGQLAFVPTAKFANATAAIRHAGVGWR